MNKLLTAALIVLLIQIAKPVPAAKDISVDWETGEVTVSEEPVDEEAEETAVRRYLEQAEAAEEKIERLNRVIETQQKVIRQQRSLIRRQREEIRHKDNLLLGMEQLLRRSRK